MRLFAYALLMLVFCILGYSLGYTNFAAQLGQEHIAGKLTDENNSYVPSFNKIACSGNSTVNGTTVPDMLCIEASQQEKDNSLFGMVGVGLLLVGGVLVLYLTGFGAMFIIPLIIVGILLNYFVLPLSFLIMPGTPQLLAVGVTAIFNLLYIMSAVDFIRGGS